MIATHESVEQPAIARKTSGLTVIVPAYNEAASIADTVRSIQHQTLPAEEIIVVDDFSGDNTGDIARATGVTVLRPPKNTGTKAGAQNFAMAHVRTEFTMAVDADTVLAPDAIEKLLAAMDDPNIAAACGFVVPQRVKTLWERGRYVEYLFAFTLYKPLQDFYNKPLISSGCFSVYRTEALRANGGWNTRTMAEDMDLTWSFYQAGRGVRFVPEAVCYPIEPPDLNMMGKQLKRWSHGFIQNVKVHWRGVLEVPYLRSIVMVAMWDTVLASVAYLVILPLLAIFWHPVVLVAYFVDLPAVFVPITIRAYQRKELLKAWASMPGFFVLRIVNSIYMLRAFFNEMILRRSLKVYEKGH